MPTTGNPWTFMEDQQVDLGGTKGIGRRGKDTAAVSKAWDLIKEDMLGYDINFEDMSPNAKEHVRKRWNLAGFANAGRALDDTTIANFMGSLLQNDGSTDLIITPRFLSMLDGVHIELSPSYGQTQPFAVVDPQTGQMLPRTKMDLDVARGLEKELRDPLVLKTLAMTMPVGLYADKMFRGGEGMAVAIHKDGFPVLSSLQPGDEIDVTAQQWADAKEEWELIYDLVSDDGRTATLKVREPDGGGPERIYQAGGFYYSWDPSQDLWSHRWGQTRDPKMAGRGPGPSGPRRGRAAFDAPKSTTVARMQADFARKKKARLAAEIEARPLDTTLLGQGGF
jgi:hypothetical protein